MPDSGYADQARHQAHQILSHAPYSSSSSSSNLPRPLAGLLDAIGRVLKAVFRPVFRWLGHQFYSLTGALGGWAWVLVVVVAVLAGVAVAFLLMRRSRRGGRLQGVVPELPPTGDPAALEAEADRRAAAGEFAAALRLRFEAGLLRLELAGLVPEQRVRTDAQMSADLGSPTFTALAHRHQAVTYAGDDAVAGDVESARMSWPRVPSEVRDHRALAHAGA